MFRAITVIILILLAIFTVAAAQTATAVFASDAASGLLQFKAGNHVLGFAPTKAYLAAVDHALTVEFLGTKGVRPAVEGDLQSSDASSKTRQLKKVVYQNLWPGINLIYSATKDGVTESTYLVAPGADVSKIRLKYNVPVELQQIGELKFKFARGYVTEAAPVAWQEIDRKKVPVKASYRLSDGTVGFKVGDYDKTKPLVIDPTYQWHSFYGSSNNEYGNKIALDDRGNIYVMGRAVATWGTPIHAFTGTKSNIFVLKIDNGGTYQWHTFYGAGYPDETPTNIAGDGAGNVYVTGRSTAPWNGPSGQAPQHSHSGLDDLFVLKLDSNGAYQWHTFYGGTTGPNRFSQGYGIAVDKSGKVYVTGGSRPIWNGPHGELPLNIPPCPTTRIFVLKLDSDGSYIWHTSYGSDTTYDYGYAIAVDDSNNSFVTGYSHASWNGPSGQPPLNPYGGGDSIMILKLDSNGAYRWHTFYAGGVSYGNAIALDYNDNAYITGYSAQSWGAPINPFNGQFNMYVLKLDASGAYKWHTFYGANVYFGNEGCSIAVDICNNVYVSGHSKGSWGAPLNTYNGGEDIVVLKLDKDGAYQWNTFYGSTSSSEYGYGIALDQAANIYVSGESDATWGNPLHTFSGGTDIHVLKLQSDTYPAGPVKIEGGGLTYSSIQDAYDVASSGQSILIQLFQLPGDLNLALGIAVTLRGGYDCGFSANPGFTTVHGQMVISGGAVTVENIIIN